MTNIEQTERALLGLMLTEARHIDAAAVLEVGDLYLESHRRIVTVIRTMHAREETVDLITFLAELDRLKMVAMVGGTGYVTDLTNDVWRGSEDAAAYLAIIKAESSRRSIRALCTAIGARAEAGEDPDQLLHDLQGAAAQTQSVGARVRATHISEHVVPTWEALQAEMSATEPTLGVPTGIGSLDAVMGGWRPGELTYVGALPGRGKTAFLLQCVHHASSRGIGVGCISLEMRAGQLMRRLATIRSGLHAYKFRDPRELNLSERQHARSSLYALGEAPVWMNDQSGLKPAAIASLARQMHAAGAKVIFCDFVQIIHEDGNDRREAINRVSATLRDTAKSLGIPFVVASQLARRQGDIDRAPTMRDLRESGNLEQDAHNVLLIHRPKNNGEWTGEDELIVEKQREGETGPVLVSYDTRSLTFVERRTERAA